MQNPTEDKRNFRTISIKKEQYDRMLELGSMGESFADVMENIMKKAELVGGSVSKREED